MTRILKIINNYLKWYCTRVVGKDFRAESCSDCCESDENLSLKQSGGANEALQRATEAAYNACFRLVQRLASNIMPSRSL